MLQKLVSLCSVFVAAQVVKLGLDWFIAAQLWSDHVHRARLLGLVVDDAAAWFCAVLGRLGFVVLHLLHRLASKWFERRVNYFVAYFYWGEDDFAWIWWPGRKHIILTRQWLLEVCARLLGNVATCLLLLAFVGAGRLRVFGIGW